MEKEKNIYRAPEAEIIEVVNEQPIFNTSGEGNGEGWNEIPF